MDEQESPENSSKKTAKDEIRNGGHIAADGSRASETAGSLDEGKSSGKAESGDDGFAFAPEELPTMQWSDVYAELAEFEALDTDGDPRKAPVAQDQQPEQSGPLGGLEDAMSWLEQLAAGQGMPIDEMPTLVSAKPKPGDLPQEDGIADEQSDEELVLPTLELDSDPMAWLEQLAVDQSSPLEELPSVADRLLASEIVSQSEIPPNSTINDPYDVDEALGYLEQLAVVQGVDLTGVSFDAGQPLDTLSAALIIVDKLALTGLAASIAALKTEASPQELEVDPDVDDPAVTAVEAVGITIIAEESEADEPDAGDQITDLTSDMPDDPLLALDWLSSFGEDSDELSLEVVTEADTLAPPLELPDEELYETEPVKENLDQGGQGANLDAGALEEMPEDPDEAVAWMERLAVHGSHSSATADEAPPSQQPSSSTVGPTPEQTAALAGAKAALEEDDLQEALRLYQALLEDESAAAGLIEALETAAEQHQESPALLRLLGDAYMQMGEVEKAIATYRKGFDHL